MLKISFCTWTVCLRVTGTSSDDNGLAVWITAGHHGDGHHGDVDAAGDADDVVAGGLNSSCEAQCERQ